MNRISYAAKLSFILLCWMTFSACQTASDPTVEPEAADAPQTGQESGPAGGDESPAVIEEATPDPALIPEAWQGGPHADAYVVDSGGSNSSCARCHAPVNWIPTMDDMPDSCFACKFEIEPPPPVIAEAEWANIPCEVCHEVDKKGNVEEGYAWLEIAQIGEYAEVASPTEICQKCHAEVDLPEHKAIQLGGAHSDYECTECHDAHDTGATCGETSCHQEALGPDNEIAGHDVDHEEVACVACHDGSDMEVGPPEDGDSGWTTLASIPGEDGTALIAVTSHNVVLEADCDRCHFIGNPWGLSESVEEE